MIRRGSYGEEARVGWLEWLPFAAALAVFFALPEYVPLGARILVYILFALSLDLILGYAGIITLGHTAFFGLGAYVAGILGAKAGVTDPLLQMAAAGAAAALLGVATGAVILRTMGLTLLMLTLAITSILLEIANKATALTGDEALQTFGASTAGYATNLARAQLARGKITEAFLTLEESRAQALQQLLLERPMLAAAMA